MISEEQQCSETHPDTGNKCVRNDGHAGDHRTHMGRQWPQETSKPDPELKTATIKQTSKPDPVVLATVEYHGATVRKELAEVNGRLEGQPVLTSNAKVLRSRRDRLASEADAWDYLEAVLRGLVKP